MDPDPNLESGLKSASAGGFTDVDTDVDTDAFAAGGMSASPRGSVDFDLGIRGYLAHRLKLPRTKVFDDDESTMNNKFPVEPDTDYRGVGDADGAASCE